MVGYHFERCCASKLEYLNEDESVGGRRVQTVAILYMYPSPLATEAHVIIALRIRSVYCFGPLQGEVGMRGLRMRGVGMSLVVIG